MNDEIDPFSELINESDDKPMTLDTDKQSAHSESIENDNEISLSPHTEGEDEQIPDNNSKNKHVSHVEQQEEPQKLKNQFFKSYPEDITKETIQENNKVNFKGIYSEVEEITKSQYKIIHQLLDLSLTNKPFADFYLSLSNRKALHSLESIRIEVETKKNQILKNVLKDNQGLIKYLEEKQFKPNKSENRSPKPQEKTDYHKLIDVINRLNLLIKNGEIEMTNMCMLFELLSDLKNENECNNSFDDIYRMLSEMEKSDKKDVNLKENSKKDVKKRNKIDVEVFNRILKNTLCIKEDHHVKNKEKIEDNTPNISKNSLQKENANRIFECERCTFINDGKIKNCEMCGANPNFKGNKHWICPSCGYDQNEPLYTSCRLCNFNTSKL